MMTVRRIYSELLDKAEVQDRSPYIFSASHGWLEKFKCRFDISNCVCSGDAASADKEAATAYMEQFRTLLEEGRYTPDQVFSVDETTLYRQIMPNRTYLTKDAWAQGSEGQGVTSLLQ